VVIDHWNDGNLPAGLVLNGDAARVVHAGAEAISLAVVLALARASSSSRQSNPDGSFNAVPSGRQPSKLQLDDLLKHLLAAWNEQRSSCVVRNNRPANRSAVLSMTNARAFVFYCAQ
jgi:hypothetical protein